jgi:hypothetical protein
LVVIDLSLKTAAGHSKAFFLSLQVSVVAAQVRVASLGATPAHLALACDVALARLPVRAVLAVQLPDLLFQLPKIASSSCLREVATVATALRTRVSVKRWR